jgi:hypothetical protein
MRRIITTLFFLIGSASISFGNENSIDSAGVYLTREDFIENRISYLTNSLPQIAWLFGVRVGIDIYSNYSIEGKIDLELPGKIIKTFKPGDIFGFYVNGRKYLYIRSDKVYLSVLNDSSIKFFLVTGMAPRLSLNPVKKLFYSRNFDEYPRRFSKKNIHKDFPSNSDTTKILLKLLEELPDNFISGKQEEYEKFVKIISSNLGKLEGL